MPNNRPKSPIIVLLIFIMLAEAVGFFFLLNLQSNSFDRKLDEILATLAEAPPQRELEPAGDPEQEPSEELTQELTLEPTQEPTEEPTQEPIAEPTQEPVVEPSQEPVVEPSQEPVVEPSQEPVVGTLPETTPEPGSPLYLVDEAPAYDWNYDKIADFYHEYSAKKSGGSESFVIGGETYTNGIVFTAYESSSPAVWCVYNLDGNYRGLDFVVGHIDKTGLHYSNLYVYIDGKQCKYLRLMPDMVPTAVSIDITGVKQLKFEVNMSERDAQYALMDPILTK